MKKFILLSAMMFTFIGVAKADELAGFFVEPMLTYERGRGDVNFPSPINSQETELDGFGVGARFGGHVWETIFLGLDARYSVPTFKSEGLNQDVDAKAWNVGPMVGAQMPFPIGLRAWGSLILAGEVDPDMGANVNEKFKSGLGFRLGAGFKVAFVSLNIEYQKIKYDKTEIQDVGVFAVNSSRDDIELDNDSMILSVSFPLAI